MDGRASALDHDHELAIPTELEGFEHHRQPRSDLPRPPDVNGNGLTVTGTGDPEARIAGKQATEAVELALDTGRVEIFQELFDLEALSHLGPPSTVRISVPKS